MNSRDRQIMCGLFLSKFDHDALEYFGFDSFTEAFNTMGYSLQSRPASIKNYRDEIDPYFPNERKGWHRRPLRDHCRRILEEYGEADIVKLGNILKGFLLPTLEIDSMPEVKRVMSIHDADSQSTFAKRLVTGKAAEQYFAVNYGKMFEFSDMSATDTTGWGCGFDFKLDNMIAGTYCVVEVKGLRARCGPIQMTELEYDMAASLLDSYYLVIVRNFAETPFHTVIKNPLNGSLSLSRMERQEVRVSWNANIVE